MRYRVTGHEQSSEGERALEIEAETEDEARAFATLEGLEVIRVDLAPHIPEPTANSPATDARTEPQQHSQSVSARSGGVPISGWHPPRYAAPEQDGRTWEVRYVRTGQADHKDEVDRLVKNAVTLWKQDKSWRFIEKQIRELGSSRVVAEKALRKAWPACTASTRGIGYIKLLCGLGLLVLCVPIIWQIQEFGANIDRLVMKAILKLFYLPLALGGWLLLIGSIQLVTGRGRHDYLGGNWWMGWKCSQCGAVNRTNSRQCKSCKAEQ